MLNDLPDPLASILRQLTPETEVPLSMLPEDATLPAGVVAEHLHVGERTDLEVDLTLEEVAEEVGRAVSTVRGWCSSGELEAYKLNSREWRVPRQALRAYLEAQREDRPAEPRRVRGRGSVDLGSWRKLRGAS